MTDAWLIIKETLFSYQGYSLLFAVFACALILLYTHEKNKLNRALFLCLPLLIILVFICPFFYKLSVRYFLDQDPEVYYRILWLVPFTIIISVGAVVFLLNLKSKPKRMVSLLLIVAFIIGFGDYTYNNNRISRMENAYKVPQVVVNLCEEIVVPGREVLAVFPASLIVYVRQYTPLIYMPYGRQMLVGRWGFSDNLYDAMEADIIDTAYLSQLAKQRDVAFIILPTDKKTAGGELSRYGFTKQSQINGFNVYRNNDAYLGLWDE